MPALLKEALLTMLARLPGLLAMLALAGFAYQAGLRSGQLQLSRYQQQVAQQQQRQQAARAAQEQARQQQLQASAAALANSQRQLQQQRQSQQRRITHAAQIPPQSGAEPAAVLSVDGLQLYNAAFGLSADSPAGAASQLAEPDATAAAIDSGISRADLLAHARDLGFWCRSAVAQRDALQQLLSEEADGEP